MLPSDHKGNDLVFLDDHPEGFLLNLFILPRSSRNVIAGLHGKALKLKLTAPPKDGEANKMCRDYLAKLFKIPKSAVTIVSGKTNRTKRVLIQCDGEETKRKILQFLIKNT